MEKQKEADKIIRNHIYGAMGVGLIPVPLIDVVAVTGVLLNMLRRLASSTEFLFPKIPEKSDRFFAGRGYSGFCFRDIGKYGQSYSGSSDRQRVH
ncbi:MAG: hypothetical protein HC887_08830 [Desulfobacteraceae bacterium]|nr:hypothetical protein [Desulfobacteraceae bacterium]